MEDHKLLVAIPAEDEVDEDSRVRPTDVLLPDQGSPDDGLEVGTEVEDGRATAVLVELAAAVEDELRCNGPEDAMGCDEDPMAATPDDPPVMVEFAIATLVEGDTEDDGTPDDEASVPCVDDSSNEPELEGCIDVA